MLEKTYTLTLSVKIETPAGKSACGTPVEETPATAEIALKVGHNFVRHLDRNQLFISLDAAITAALVAYEEANGIDFKLHPNHLANMNDHMDRFPDFIDVKPC